MFEPKKSLLTVRRAVWLLLRKPEEQSDSDSEVIALLKQQHPNLNMAIELAQSFADERSSKAARAIRGVV